MNETLIIILCVGLYGLDMKLMANRLAKITVELNLYEFYEIFL